MANGRGLPIQDAWKSLPYFHEDFSTTEEVSKYIKKKARGKAGHFLLRPSNRDRNRLTASIYCSDDSVRHTNISYEMSVEFRSLYYLVPEKKFESLSLLVEYYGVNPVKNMENISNVFLKKPIMNKKWLNNGNFDALSRSSSDRSLSLHSSMSTLSMSNGSLGGMATTFDSGSSSSLSTPTLPGQTLAQRSDSFGNTSVTNGGTSVRPLPLPNMSCIERRPPLPLPSAVSDKKEDGPYMYSKARDVTEDISEQLKDVLKASERCECGIPRHLAELPKGWTVHLSKDAPTIGRLFYQNDAGITSWALPDDVKMQLTKKHIQNLTTIDPNWKVQR
ncbi:uncharacterized protein LOC127880703 [Dreissena polymorpha]|uniref:Uncharacterized protein n=1 Tax=Dreissena polymorpha TaxID=45954 RepID=A0A9D4MQA9_DREPO|nr:uncharacterized protein LOC127880703 [Dreissena polymorpha]KAH3881480.1 hypothetical protein DPMN_005406 [Dreissena polymorpha]